MTLYIGPLVVLDWTDNLWKASLRKDAKPEDKPKFGVTSLWLHGCEDTPEYKTILAAVEEAAIARFGRTQYETLVEERKFSSPFRIDIGSKGYDKTRFKFLVTSESGEKHPPAVRNVRVRGPDGKPAFITDPREMYPGVIAKVSYSVRAYGGLNTGYDPGVKLDLRNVLKWQDADRLSVGGTGGDEFGDVEAPPPDTAADDADMAALLA